MIIKKCFVVVNIDSFYINISFEIDRNLLKKWIAKKLTLTLIFTIKFFIFYENFLLFTRKNVYLNEILFFLKINLQFINYFYYII